MKKRRDQLGLFPEEFVIKPYVSYEDQLRRAGKPYPPPDKLSYQDAAERRDDGIERASKHAEKVHLAWRLLAEFELEKYLLLRRDDAFLAEEFVDWCRKEGRLEQPPDGRAWGSVFSSARRLGIIERVGTRNAATSNLSPKPLWRAFQVL